MDLAKLESLKPEQVTPAIKQAVAAWLLAKAYAETKREQVDAIGREELAAAAYMVAPENRKQDGTPERIHDPKYAWLMSDVDYADYAAQCNKVERERGVKPADMSDDHCPALVAESLLMDAERVLVAATNPITGVEWHHVARYLPGRKKLAVVEWCELWAKIVICLPDFVNPLTGKAA